MKHNSLGLMNLFITLGKRIKMIQLQRSCGWGNTSPRPSALSYEYVRKPKVREPLGYCVDHRW